MGNVRHIQYRDFFWLRFTGGGDPLLKGAPFAGRPRLTGGIIIHTTGKGRP